MNSVLQAVPSFAAITWFEMLSDIPWPFCGSLCSAKHAERA